MTNTRLLTFSLLSIALRCRQTSKDTTRELSAKVILDWSAHTEHALVVDSNNIDPLPATRTITMVHVAMHDAINAARPRFTTYAYGDQDPDADPIAAAASAAHRVLVVRFPAQAADLDAKLAASLAQVADGIAETRGIALGVVAGDAIVAKRASDGSASPLPYTPGTGVGRYQFVPPFDGFINRPEWRQVTPWTLASAQQFSLRATSHGDERGCQDVSCFCIRFRRSVALTLKCFRIDSTHLSEAVISGRRNARNRNPMRHRPRWTGQIRPVVDGSNPASRSRTSSCSA